MKFNNRNTYISPTAKIGQNVKIGDNCTIYDNVEIGDNSIICNDSVIGEPLNAYYSNPDYVNPPTKIGKNSLIRSHAIIYADTTLGDHFNAGHRVIIREEVTMGKYCSVGSQSIMQGYTTVGDYTRIHTNILVSQYSKLGSFIYIFPYTSFSNDPHPPSTLIRGCTIGDFTQIAVHCCLLPGVTIGRNCLIGVKTTVTKDVPDGSFLLGTPGKIMGPITMIKSKVNPEESHYPWMYNFERGMPWEGIGYDKWRSENPEFSIDR